MRGTFVQRIEIKTFGVRWGLYPGVPPKDVLQHVVDLRGMLADPGSTLPNKTGLDPEISTWILTQPGVVEWLGREKELMRQRIRELTASGFFCLTVYYHCHGGCQRSVAIAEAIAQWIKEEFGHGHTVRVEHLTMLLTQTDKAAKATTKAAQAKA